MHSELAMSSPLEPVVLARAPWRDRWLRQAVFARLSKLEHGCVTVTDAEGAHDFGQVSPKCPLRATVVILMILTLTGDWPCAAASGSAKAIWRVNGLAPIYQPCADFRAESGCATGA